MRKAKLLMNRNKVNLLIRWKENYYFGSYYIVDFSDNLIRLTAKKISYSDYLNRIEDYPTLCIDSDILFGIGDNIDHILRFDGEKIGRLNAKETRYAQDIYKMKGVWSDIKSYTMIE